MTHERITVERAATRTVAALVDFANEHGVPNGVTLGELRRQHGGAPPMIAGRAAHTHGFLARASKVVTMEYGEPVTIEYDRGHFALTRKVPR
jgi:hypothetical protein